MIAHLAKQEFLLDTFYCLASTALVTLQLGRFVFICLDCLWPDFCPVFVEEQWSSVSSQAQVSHLQPEQTEIDST